MAETIPFFCIGSQKTGTTLLARLIDQHPGAACIFESYAFRPTGPTSIFNRSGRNWQVHGFRPDDVERWSQAWGPSVRERVRRKLGPLLPVDVLGRRSFARTMPEALEDFGRRCGA